MQHNIAKPLKKPLDFPSKGRINRMTYQIITEVANSYLDNINVMNRKEKNNYEHIAVTKRGTGHFSSRATTYSSHVDSCLYQASG